MAGGKLPIGSQRFAVPTVGENPEVSSLETIRADEAVAVFDGDMAAPIVLDVAGGQAGIFSTRSPGKSSPNEDAAAVIPLGERTAVLAVADGCGGHAAGEQAARIAIELLHQRVAAAADPELGLREAILDAFELANKEIDKLGLGAATTLAVAEIQGGEVRTYHTGDSDILVTGQRGRVKMQTLAHAPTAYAVEAGLMNELDAMHHEDRALISNIVGAPDMRVDVGSAMALAARDTLLLASDGVADNLWLREIVNLIRVGPVADAAAQLAEASSRRMVEPAEGEPSKPDDLTFILFRRWAN